MDNQFNALTANLCTSLLEHFANIGHLSRAIDANIAALGSPQSISQHNGAAMHKDALSSVDSSKAVAVALLCVAICTMHETPRSIHTALLLAAVCILMSSMRNLQDRAVSNAVGYTESNSITLIDAMGQQLVLPLELCATRDVSMIIFDHERRVLTRNRSSIRH